MDLVLTCPAEGSEGDVGSESQGETPGSMEPKLLLDGNRRHVL